MSILIAFGLITFSCLIIWRASDGFEAASEYLGRNLTEGVRGATINAIGSSMPEVFTTLFFLFILQEGDGFAGGIGTTAGSAIFNGMIIPSCVILTVIYFGIASSVQISRKVVMRDGIALILAELSLILLIRGDTLHWWHGLILMSLYGVYVGYMLSTMKKGEANHEETETEEEEDETIQDNKLLAWLTLDLKSAVIGRNEIRDGNAWMLLIVSMLVIAGSCAMLVHSCELMGHYLHIPIYFVAVIIASAATSVPDTILSLKDAKKGNFDDAVSNALGSNIFDICFALGFPLFLYTIIYEPIQMSPSVMANISELRILLLLLTIGAFLIFIIKRSMGVIQAILLFLLYIVFTSFILGQAMGYEWAKAIAEQLRNIAAFLN